MIRAASLAAAANPVHWFQEPARRLVGAAARSIFLRLEHEVVVVFAAFIRITG